MGDLHDPATGRWPRGPRDGRVFVQREVGVPLAVIGEVLLEVAAQGALIPGDDVVEALAADRADHAFGAWIGVSRQLHRRGAVRPGPFESPIPFIRYVGASTS